MTLKEFYEQVGGDSREVLRRLPSEAMVRKFVKKFPGDPSMGQLTRAMVAEDWETAFRAAHTLKGVAQNLGLERLYRAADPLTEALRDKKFPADPGLWKRTEDAYHEAIGQIENL